MLLLAVEWGGVTYAWSSANVIGLLCGAVVIIIIFFVWEGRRGDTAMIPFFLLKNRVVICACLTMTLSQGSLMVVTYYIPLWFQVVKDASPTMGGVYYLPSVGSQVVGSIMTGALSKYFPSDRYPTRLTKSLSFKTGLLHPVRHRRYSFDLNLMWSLQHIDTKFKCWDVGRLSNHLRLLSRPDHAAASHGDSSCDPKI